MTKERRPFSPMSQVREDEDMHVACETRKGEEREEVVIVRRDDVNPPQHWLGDSAELLGYEAATHKQLLVALVDCVAGRSREAEDVGENFVWKG